MLVIAENEWLQLRKIDDASNNRNLRRSFSTRRLDHRIISNYLGEHQTTQNTHGFEQLHPLLGVVIRVCREKTRDTSRRRLLEYLATQIHVDPLAFTHGIALDTDKHCHNGPSAHANDVIEQLSDLGGDYTL